MSDYFDLAPIRLNFRASLFMGLREEDYRRPLRDARELLGSYEAISAAGVRPKPALARAAIVMTMSGWQAYVQLLAETLLISLEPHRPVDDDADGDDTTAYERDFRYWQLRRGEVLKGVADFSTPNSDNCRNLLLRLGFDPWPIWSVTDGRAQLSPVQTRARLDDWLRVRHALAHGGPLPEVAVLDRSRSGALTLTRRSAERCSRFVSALIVSTHRHFYPRSLREHEEIL